MSFLLLGPTSPLKTSLPTTLRLPAISLRKRDHIGLYVGTAWAEIRIGGLEQVICRGLTGESLARDTHQSTARVSSAHTHDPRLACRRADNPEAENRAR